MSSFDLVVVAASLGGPPALRDLLHRLPADFTAPIVVVQHRAPSTSRLAEILDRATALPVVAAGDGDLLMPGVVYVAPADRQILIGSTGRIALSGDARGRCLADPLFESAADTSGSSTIAVVLTGSMTDGAAGVQAVKMAGGRVLVQTPQEAVAPGMPLAALGTGCVDHVLPIAGIASALAAFVMADGAAALFTVPPPHWAAHLA